MSAATQLEDVDLAEWEFFRMTGSPLALQQSLDRLRSVGWVVAPAVPVPGPFDTWTVLVRRPARISRGESGCVAS